MDAALFLPFILPLRTNVFSHSILLQHMSSVLLLTALLYPLPSSTGFALTCLAG